jgi:small redox-active disulfide protein 2
MDVKVLGPGCAKCKKLYAEAQRAVELCGVRVTLVKLEKIEDIMAYGVMSTPALVIGAEVKSVGRIVPAAEIAAMITAAIAKG